MSSKNLPPLPPLPPRMRMSARGQSEMRVCPVCGQDYDLLDLEQAYHHVETPHDPLPPR